MQPYAGAAGGAGGAAGADAVAGVAPAAEPPAGEDGNGKRTLASVLAALEKRKYRSKKGDNVVQLNDVAFLVLPLGLGRQRRGWGTITTNTKAYHKEVCKFLGGTMKGRHAKPRRVQGCNGGRKAKCVPHQLVADRLRAMDEDSLLLKWNGPG